MKIIDIEKEVQVGDIILEAGDKIEVMKESFNTESLDREFSSVISYMINQGADSANIGYTIGHIVSTAVQSAIIDDAIMSNKEEVGIYKEVSDYLKSQM